MPFCSCFPSHSVRWNVAKQVSHTEAWVLQMARVAAGADIGVGAGTLGALHACTSHCQKGILQVQQT
jgi:hypothetical protein